MPSLPPLSTIQFYSLKTTILLNVSSTFLRNFFFFLLRNQEVYIQSVLWLITLFGVLEIC